MKSKLELLQQFKKANKIYKAKLANNAGFLSIEEYLAYLTGPKRRAPKVVKKVLPKQTIHIVNILDASGSMDGGKYNNSCDGMRQELVELRNNKDVNYTYTFIEFVESGKVITHNFLSELPSTLGFWGANGRNTPLYHTVYESLTKVTKAISFSDKTLVKVYTDGGDNALTGYARKTGQLIKDLEKSNVTTTFVATKGDMPRIMADLSLEESNTLAVDNSAQGFMDAFNTSTTATMMYSSRVASGQSGEALTKGFYKKVGKL